MLTKRETINDSSRCTPRDSKQSEQQYIGASGPMLTPASPEGNGHTHFLRKDSSRETDSIPMTPNQDLYPRPFSPDTAACSPFKIEATGGNPLRCKVINTLASPMGKVMGLPQLNALYQTIQNLSHEEDFLDRVIEAMQVGYRVSDEDLARIPKSGPCVVVANHPFGAIEGVLLMLLLARVRPDFKVMGTYFLKHIPDLIHRIIFVDNMGKNTSLRSNIRPLKESIRCLKEGNLLAIFPAGEVSHMTFRKRRVTDPAWSPTVSRIIHKTHAPVVPIYFDGRNSMFFQAMGLLHPMLRTILLPREFMNKERTTFDISIGSAIPYKKLSGMEDKDLVNYLRLRTYILKQRYAERNKRGQLPILPVIHPGKPSTAQNEPKPALDVAPPVDPALLQKDIDNLPDECLLHETGDYTVYACKGDCISRILKEIGRLREVTFRLVGEGTGKEIDLDTYDNYYDHLFIWNREKREIVGAYRIGKTDEIIEEFGIEGLYTSSLFHFKPALFDRMGKSLEMGRSFIRPEYQKSFSALFMLWKGIGCYVLRNPEHVVLFGPVSISNDYSSVSRELIVRYVKTKDSISHLHKLVKPKTPPKLKSLKRHELREFRNAFKSVEDVTEVIGDLEPEFKGIPVLLRQYLKLGGKVLAFNVDADFQDCLDGLIKVDLLKTPTRVLAMYMGKENVELLHDYHEAKRQPNEN